MEKTTLNYIPTTICQLGESCPVMDPYNTLCKDDIMVVPELLPEFLKQLVVVPFFTSIKDAKGELITTFRINVWLELNRP